MYDDADGDEAKPETCSLQKKRCQRRIMPSTRVEAIGGVKVCDLKPQCMCTHTHTSSLNLPHTHLPARICPLNCRFWFKFPHAFAFLNDMKMAAEKIKL